MKTIDEFLDWLANEETAQIQAPASIDEIARCQKALEKKRLPSIPQGYIDFLRKCNGFVWGVRFLGTKSYHGNDPESDSIRKDLVSANKAFIKDCEFRPHCLLIGEGNEDYYIYNTKTQLYEIISETYQTWEEHETFAALFHEACELDEDDEDNEKSITELAKELLVKNKYADYKSNTIKVTDDCGNQFVFLFSSTGYNEYTQYVFKCHSDLYENPIMFSITTISDSFDFCDVEYDGETVSKHEKTLRHAIELALTMEAAR